MARTIEGHEDFPHVEVVRARRLRQRRGRRVRIRRLVLVAQRAGRARARGALTARRARLGDRDGQVVGVGAARIREVGRARSAREQTRARGSVRRARHHASFLMRLPPRRLGRAAGRPDAPRAARGPPEKRLGRPAERPRRFLGGPQPAQEASRAARGPAAGGPRRARSAPSASWPRASGVRSSWPRE